MQTQPSPEQAIVVLAETIGTEKWDHLLELLRILLEKDGKTITNSVLTVQDFAALTKCSDDIARLEFQRNPTFRVGSSRRMAWSTFKKNFLDRKA